MSWEVAYDPKDVVPGLHHRVVAMAHKRRPKRRPKITKSSDVYDLIRDGAGLDREAFWVLPLDAKKRLIGLYVGFIGGTSATMVDELSLLRFLLIVQASSVVLVHNHPSGINDPSSDDVQITAKIGMILEVFGIELTDHLILGEHTGFFSFADAGLV